MIEYSVEACSTLVMKLTAESALPTMTGSKSLEPVWTAAIQDSRRFRKRRISASFSNSPILSRKKSAPCARQASRYSR